MGAVGAMLKNTQSKQFLDIQFPEPASITLIFSLSHIIKRQAPPLLYGCAVHTCMVVVWFVLFIQFLYMFVHPQFVYLDLQTE